MPINGGRNEIGLVAGFISEYLAGTIVICNNSVVRLWPRYDSFRNSDAWLAVPLFTL
jgi:hypothetical protein